MPRARDRRAVEPGARDAGVDRCPLPRPPHESQQAARSGAPMRRGERGDIRRRGLKARRRLHRADAGPRGTAVRRRARPGASSALAMRTAGWRTSSRPACCAARARSTGGSRPLVPRGWASVAPELKEVLRLGAFQLTALDRVPAHAAVDTSVALAKETGGARAGGFVNAVLRRLRASASRPREGRRRERRADGHGRGARACGVASAVAGGALDRAVRRGRDGRAAPVEQHPAATRAAAGARTGSRSSSGGGGTRASRSSRHRSAPD